MATGADPDQLLLLCRPEARDRAVYPGWVASLQMYACLGDPRPRAVLEMPGRLVHALEGAGRYLDDLDDDEVTTSAHATERAHEIAFSSHPSLYTGVLDCVTWVVTRTGGC